MGEWIKQFPSFKPLILYERSEMLDTYIECSKCHICLSIHMPWKNYCPNCGDKKKNEEE